MNISATIRAFLNAHQLDGLGIVAVSGGADSIALLRGMLDNATVHVVHFNHQLRGEASDADAAFVEATANHFQRPITTVSADVTKLAEGENWEATARTFRYDHLQRLAEELQAGWVATGHTADDQAETVLHHLIRGSGLSGLRGIAPIRPLTDNGVSLVRPLLNVTRNQVETFLTELGQEYRTDATNVDAKFTRNRIRHELRPMLRSFNPGIDNALSRAADHFREVDDYLQQQAVQLLNHAARPKAGTCIVLDVNALAQAPQLLRCEVYRMVWRSMGWPIAAMTRQHWHRVDAVAVGSATACDFPANVHVRRVGSVIQLHRQC